MIEIIDGVPQGGGGSSAAVVYNSFRKELYDNHQTKFRAWNLAVNATDGLADWKVTKYYWLDDNNYKSETLTGSWALRNSLPFTI